MGFILRPLVSKKHFAADAPALVAPDQHEEIRVADAAPVLRLEARHGGRPAKLDRDDARLKLRRRTTSLYRLAKSRKGPLDRLAALAAADIRAVHKGAPHQAGVASARGLDIVLQSCGDRLLVGCRHDAILDRKAAAGPCEV